jgi:replication factor A1
MQVKDLKPKEAVDTITLTITEKSPPREFQKFGKPGRVCSATGTDESGAVTVSLWNDEIEAVNVGDKIKITEGFCTEWQGKKQVTAGRKGKLEKV